MKLVLTLADPVLSRKAATGLTGVATLLTVSEIEARTAAVATPRRRHSGRRGRGGARGHRVRVGRLRPGGYAALARATIEIYRLTIAPEKGSPIGENDPTPTLGVVESGVLTLRVDGPITVGRT